MVPWLRNLFSKKSNYHTDGTLNKTIIRLLECCFELETILSSGSSFSNFLLLAIGSLAAILRIKNTRNDNSFVIKRMKRK